MNNTLHHGPRSALALAVIMSFLLLYNLIPVEAADGTDFNANTLGNQLPVITIWYPDALNFGQLGNPQDQVNILGNVTDPDGSVASLTYSLNKGPATGLSLGTGNKRLINPGDFNINLFTKNLNNGQNTLVLKATDNSGGIQTKTVYFNYSVGNTWPLPYATDWAAAAAINDQAQVVDGLWHLSASSVEPVSFGYDRLVALGDGSWTDYEIVAEVTVHGFYPDPTNLNDAGGVGVISRWPGHFTDPTSPSEQPPTGWWHLGAYGYYSNRLGKLTLRMDQNTVYTQSYPFSLETTYLFKLRTETAPGASVGTYSFKIWPKGTPEPSWNDSRFTNIVFKSDVAGDEPNGGVLLVAHRADATFGNVTICPLSSPSYALSAGSSSGGSVISSTGSTNNSYSCGERVTLTARANPGYTFAGWTGTVQSSSPTIDLSMVKDYYVTANFTAGQTLGGTLYLPYLNR